MICPNCGRENIDRNYYCSWCDTPLKNKGAAKPKKLKERYNYLLDLDVVEENTNEKDYYGTYKSKKKK